MTYQLDPDCTLPPRLVQLFLRSAPSQLGELAQACEERDAELARAQAHKFKGGLYAAGASRLADDVEALRAALAKPDWPTSDQQLQAIRHTFASVLVAFEQQLLGGKP